MKVIQFYLCSLILFLTFISIHADDLEEMTRIENDDAIPVLGDEKNVIDFNFEMSSLNALFNLNISNSATMLLLSGRQSPASITTISQKQIQQSGARDLDELLEIYVPGLQIMLKGQAGMIGIRGIISDRNNKLLLVVNGKNLSNKTVIGGPMSERYLSMLDDIKEINIIRGPGSAVFGPGAIAGVINITTQDAYDVHGFEASARAGAIEEFQNAQIKYGKFLRNGLEIFSYYGMDNYRGSNQKDSPLYWSKGFTTKDGVIVESGKEFTPTLANYRASRYDWLRHKFHFELSSENFEVWTRFTKGGTKTTSPRVRFVNAANDKLLNDGMAYEQLTIAGHHKKNINNKLHFENDLSYVSTDIVFNETDATANAYNEKGFLWQSLGFYEFKPEQRLSFGFELSKDSLGNKSNFHSEKKHIIYNNMDESWDVSMLSFLSEYQWQISEPLLAIFGFRSDKHDYTKNMYSPRVAFVHTANNKNIYKYIYNRSIRKTDEADLKREELAGSPEGDIDTIDNFEFRYERAHNNQLWFALSSYYNKHEVVSWDSAKKINTSIGTLQTYGLELEGIYKTQKTRFTFSHNYTKLLDFDTEVAIQNLTSMPYGYGHDLANWSNHNTKFIFEVELKETWFCSASLRINWGYPGAKDLADFNKGDKNNALFLPTYEDTVTRAFEHSAMLNLGVEHSLKRNDKLRLDLFGVLGLFDDKLNKRNYFQRSSKYFTEAPSIALSYRKKFGH